MSLYSDILLIHGIAAAINFCRLSWASVLQGGKNLDKSCKETQVLKKMIVDCFV